MLRSSAVKIASRLLLGADKSDSVEAIRGYFHKSLYGYAPRDARQI